MSIDHTLTPLALSLFSAVTVALANFAVKRGGDVLTTRMVLAVSMALTVAPIAPFVPAPPRDLWDNLAIAVMVHWIYQFAMIKALHRGDLSLVFPVMRGLAPTLTAALAFFVLNETLAPVSIAGLLIASLALIVFALPSAATLDAARLDRIALFWAGATAVGVALYSVIDASVARAMPSPFTFVVWLFLFDWIGVTAAAVYARRGRLMESIRPQLKNGVLGGIAGAFSYGAAIIAFTLTETAFVTALRETSVLFAALLGWAFLREGFGPRRIAAATVLAAGLAMMQLGQ